MPRHKILANLTLILAFAAAAAAQRFPLGRSLPSHTSTATVAGAHALAPAGLGSNPFLLIDYPAIANQFPAGINDKGKIVGVVNFPDGSFRGYLLQGTTFKSIAFPGAAGTAALAINKTGAIVGAYCPDLACTSGHGFLLKSGIYTSIDFPGALNTDATGINAAGDIVGAYQSADGIVHGFLLHQGAFTSFDVPGALNTSPLGINKQGTIVGNFSNRDGSGGHGFILQNGAFTQIDFPAAYGTGLGGINDAGDIVGAYSEAQGGPSHGLLLSGGVFTKFDVPFPGSEDTGGNAINNNRQIVGLYGTFAQDFFFGFLTTY